MGSVDGMVSRAWEERGIRFLRPSVCEHIVAPRCRHQRAVVVGGSPSKNEHGGERGHGLGCGGLMGGWQTARLEASAYQSAEE